MTTLERASTAAPRPELDWERDWQGRPRILPDPTWTPDTAPPAWVQDGQVLESREYTRVTTFAEALQDSSALTRWKMRRAVLGMGRRPDYVVTAASLSAEDRDRDALDDLAEKALEASGPNAADVGTALHAFTDRIDRGEDVGEVPEQYRGTLDAYTHAVRHLRFVEWECRTVCDELETGGTPDRLGFCDIPDPDGVVDELRIIDTKTGRVDYSAGKFSTQLAIYRRSAKYHPGTGERTSWETLHGAPVARWGIVVHVPAGADTAELLWIDLDHGWTGAQQCQRTRAWRQQATAGRLLQPVFARAPRPATTDGSCRGRKVDGTACGYRRKAKADGLGSLFCGRHQDQSQDLERWLAENPDADPDAGVETPPSRSPVQPSTPAVQPATPDAGVEQLREEAQRRGILTTEHALPNGHVSAAPGAVVITPSGEQWVKVQRDDVFGWEPAERVTAAGGADLVRCTGTGLLVTQCACSVHRPEHADLAQLAYNAAAGIAQEQEEPQPVRELRTIPAEHGDGSPASIPVGTYALDPDAEINGNPRPVSGLQTPADAAQALRSARAALFDLIDACRTETELELLYGQWSGIWTEPHTVRAGERSAQLRETFARERPEAALLAALETAPDDATLTRLWQEHGGSQLWTSVCTVTAQNRHAQLAAMARL